MGRGKGGEKLNKGQMFVKLKKRKERKKIKKKIREMRKKIEGIKGLKEYLKKVKRMRFGGRSKKRKYKIVLKQIDEDEERLWQKKIEEEKKDEKENLVDVE